MSPVDDIVDLEMMMMTSRENSDDYYDDRNTNPFRGSETFDLEKLKSKIYQGYWSVRLFLAKTAIFEFMHCRWEHLHWIAEICLFCFICSFQSVGAVQNSELYSQWEFERSTQHQTWQCWQCWQGTHQWLYKDGEIDLNLGDIVFISCWLQTHAMLILMRSASSMTCCLVTTSWYVITMIIGYVIIIVTW